MHTALGQVLASFRSAGASVIPLLMRYGQWMGNSRSSSPDTY